MPRMLSFERSPQGSDEVRPALACLTLGDKLQRLALLAPDAVRAIEILTDEALAVWWPMRKP